MYVCKEKKMVISEGDNNRMIIMNYEEDSEETPCLYL